MLSKKNDNHSEQESSPASKRRHDAAIDYTREVIEVIAVLGAPVHNSDAEPPANEQDSSTDEQDTSI